MGRKLACHAVMYIFIKNISNTLALVIPIVVTLKIYNCSTPPLFAFPEVATNRSLAQVHQVLAQIVTHWHVTEKFSCNNFLWFADTFIWHSGLSYRLITYRTPTP